MKTCFLSLERSFRIVNYTPDLKKADVDRAIHNAFNIWADVTPLTFKKLHEGMADIMISFGTKGRPISLFWPTVDTFLSVILYRIYGEYLDSFDNLTVVLFNIQ